MGRKAKEPYGKNKKNMYRHGIMDATAKQHEALIVRYYEDTIGRAVFLHGDEYSRSRLMSLVIADWARDVADNRPDSLEDLQAWLEEYVRVAYVESDVETFYVFMNMDTYANAQKVYKYLTSYPGLQARFLKSNNGGVSWQVLFWLALKRMAEKIKREHPNLVRE